MNKIPYEERCLIYAAALDKWGIITQLCVTMDAKIERLKEKVSGD